MFNIKKIVCVVSVLSSLGISGVVLAKPGIKIPFGGFTLPLKEKTTVYQGVGIYEGYTGAGKASAYNGSECDVEVTIVEQGSSTSEGNLDITKTFACYTKSGKLFVDSGFSIDGEKVTSGTGSMLIYQNDSDPVFDSTTVTTTTEVGKRSLMRMTFSNADPFELAYQKYFGSPYEATFGFKGSTLTITEEWCYADGSYCDSVNGTFELVK